MVDTLIGSGPMKPEELTGVPAAGDLQQPSGGDPWTIMASLLSGMIVWGGAGWWLDRHFGTRYWTLIGLLVGTSAAFYLVWIRLGRPGRTAPKAHDDGPAMRDDGDTKGRQ